MQSLSHLCVGVLEGVQLSHGLGRDYHGVWIGSHYGPGCFHLSARTNGTHITTLALSAF